MVRTWPLWLGGLTLKLVGSSWDVSSHFRFLRETTSYAHLVNLAGFLLIGLAFILEWRRRTPARQGALNLVLLGFFVFLAAIPADEVWHRVFGLDLTTWSPPHILLFSGTSLTLLGLVFLHLADMGWRPGRTIRDLRPGGASWVILGVLLLFLFESMAFPLTYNEYAVVGAWNHFQGEPLYDADAHLEAHAESLADPYWGGLPHWLYPSYAVALAVLMGLAVRRVVGVPGTALGLLGGYVLLRVAADGVLAATGWPPSALPWHLLPVGLAVEAAALLRAPALQAAAAAVLATLASYGTWWWAQGRIFAVPLDFAVLPLAVLAALGAAFLGGRLPERLVPWIELYNADPTRYAPRAAQGWLAARR